MYFYLFIRHKTLVSSRSIDFLEVRENFGTAADQESSKERNRSVLSDFRPKSANFEFRRYFDLLKSGVAKSPIFVTQLTAALTFQSDSGHI
jgi:hypothetical protein